MPKIINILYLVASKLFARYKTATFKDTYEALNHAQNALEIPGRHVLIKSAKEQAIEFLRSNNIRAVNISCTQEEIDNDYCETILQKHIKIIYHYNQ